MDKYTKIIELLNVVDFSSTNIDNQVHTIFNLLYENFPSQAITEQTIEECSAVLKINVKEELLENIAEYSENIFPIAVAKYLIMGVGLDRKQLIPLDDFCEHYDQLILKSV